MYCKKCGMKVENSGFCPNCGAENTRTPADKKARRASNGGKGKWLAVALALVVIVGAVIGVAHYNSPESVAERYCKALFTDPGEVLKLYAVDTKRAIGLGEDDLGMLGADSTGFIYDADTPEEYFESLRLVRQDSLEEEYDEYTISSEARTVKDISVKKLRAQESRLIKALEGVNLLDADEISDAKVVDVKWKIKSEDEKEIYYYTVYTVKLNGVWRVIDIAFGNTPLYNQYFYSVTKDVSDKSGEEEIKGIAAISPFLFNYIWNPDLWD